MDLAPSVHAVGDLRATSGGPSRSVTAVCDALSRVGSDVALVTAEADAEAPLILPACSSVRLRVVRTNPRAGLWRGADAPLGRAVQSAFPLNVPAVVHTHGLWVPAVRAAALTARPTKRPLVVSPKGMLSARALAVKPLKKRVGWHLYQRRLLSQAAAFQATSEREAADIRRLGFRQPIAVIPHGVATAPPHAPRSGGHGRQALFLSRFHPIKGIPDLVEAWALVRPAGWRLLLAGPDEGGHRAEVERLIADRGLSDTVTVRGAVGEDEKRSLLGSADLFVLATHSENFGVVVAEALAAGLPVITTRGAPWESLITHKCGWWTNVGSQAVAEALRDATSLPPDALQAMGARGKAYVDAELSWERSARSHLALYGWLLGGEPPASILFD